MIPSLPPVLGNKDQLVQVFLNLAKNAAEAIAAGRRGGRDHLHDGLPARHPPHRTRHQRAHHAAARGLHSRHRPRRAGRTAPEHLRSLRDHQARRQRAWAWRWSPRSCAIMAASSNASDASAARRSACCCRCCAAVRSRRRDSKEEQLMSAKTVLIADDDSAIRTVLTQALSRAGYSVRSTATAAALWRWVTEGQGDAVVTDVVLPDENAFDVLPRIKKLRPDSSGHRDERQEHHHDGHHGGRARCLRLPAKAVRSQCAGADRRARARTVVKAGAGQQQRAGRGAAHRRPLARHAGNLPHHRPPDADRSHRDDRGRVRHRQGACGAGAP